LKKQIAFFVCLFILEAQGSAQLAPPTCSVSGQVVASQPTNLTSLRVQVYDLVQHTRVAMVPVMTDGSFRGPAIDQVQYMISLVTDRDEQIVETMVQMTPGCAPITLRLPEESGSKPVSGTVSLSRLAHHVPARAVKAFQRSQQAARSGDQTAWFQHLQEALAADPYFFEAHVNLGAAYMARNEPRQASEQFAHALKLDPSSLPGWTDLAIAQLHIGAGDQAEESARHALRLDPTCVAAHYALALSWVIQRRFEQPIIEHLQEAYSKYPHAHIVAAQALAGVRKFAEARAQVESYLESGNVPDRAKVEEFLRRLEDLQGRERR
jgi:tetratricopeptide (TPR) repeat protein